MTTPAVIETYVPVQSLKGDDCKDAFVDAGVPYIVGPVTFGGRLVSQSILAAQATVADTFCVSSIQTSYIRAGRADVPATYRVERISDSGGSANRIVRATQGNVVLCVATIRLAKSRIGEQTRRSFAAYDHPMPDLGNAKPEDLREGANEEECKAMYFPFEAIKAGPAQPFEWRSFPFLLDSYKSPYNIQLLSFIRASPMQSDKFSDHMAGLAWATDNALPTIAMLANYATTAKLGADLKFRLSLQHNIYIHDPTARIDDWMVSQCTTSWSDGNRVMVGMKVWGRESKKLILTAHQEYLVAVGQPKL